MLTLIYPYRDRELDRIRKSLDSLSHQSSKDFEVQFVDYGSRPERAMEVEHLLEQYTFATYQYYPTHFQPWNKCRALNSVIKELEEGYCFVADVDMIFHSEFIETAISLQKTNTATYFQVGFLTEAETKKDQLFEEYSIDFTSDDEATGLTMFPVNKLHELHGFDEFYHFWGAEDTDMHVRFRNSGGQVEFYDDRILMLHQWHPSYRSKETGKITANPQVDGVVKLNQYHYLYAEENGLVKVNPTSWGTPLTVVDFERLHNFNGVTRYISNKKEEVEHLVFSELKNLGPNIQKFDISLDSFQSSLKFKAKKGLGKKVPMYYSLKEINDMLLLNIISYYRNYPYIYEVHEAENKIQLTIFKPLKV